MSKINPIIQCWVTPKLPSEHIFVDSDKRPKALNELIRLYFTRWLAHPIRRRLARYYLMVLKNFFGIKVVAITGSAGKTTTKEMVYSILRKDGLTVASFKNIDSIYNIPTTIFKCSPKTKYLVLEMGVEFKGEMDFYLWLAKPDVAVVTNVSKTHTQFLGDIEGVAKEKGKIVASLAREDIAVLNKNNKYTIKMGKITKAKIIWFGKEGNIQAKDVRLDASLNTKYTLLVRKSKINVQLPIPGKQFVENSLAAAGVAHALGVPKALIKRGLASYNKPEHRMRPVRLKSGTLILDDTYNNNPAAAREALDTLEIASRKKTKVVVMGDMLELGSDEVQEHKRLGKIIAKMDVEAVIGVGQAAKYIVEEAAKKIKSNNAVWVSTHRKVLPHLSPYLKKDTVILIKGSRSIGLERIVSKLSKAKEES